MRPSQNSHEGVKARQKRLTNHSKRCHKVSSQRGPRPGRHHVGIHGRLGVAAKVASQSGLVSKSLSLVFYSVSGPSTPARLLQSIHVQLHAFSRLRRWVLSNKGTMLWLQTPAVTQRENTVESVNKSLRRIIHDLESRNALASPNRQDADQQEGL
jgi:hypothetical protein